MRPIFDSIPICRSIFKHWVFKDAEYLKVWLTMLGRARYKREPKTVMYEKVVCTINYGEFIFGRPTWSKELGISEQRLRRLVDLLIQDTMLEIVLKTNRFTVYKIVNYEKFNQQSSQETQGSDGIEQPADNQQATSRQPADNQQTTNNEEGNKKDKDIIHILQNYTDNETLLESLIEFMKIRKKAKAQNTERAIKMLLNELDKLADTDTKKIEIVNRSIMNGWKGVFPIKDQQQPQQPARKKTVIL